MKYLNTIIGFYLLLPLPCYSCASDYLDTAPYQQIMSANEYLSGFSTVNQEWIWSIYDSAEETVGRMSIHIPNINLSFIRYCLSM